MQYLGRSFVQHFFIYFCVLWAFNLDTCRCDDSLGNDSVYVRASDADIHHPYTILLRIGSKYFCSGAIVDVRWIISAAQCHRSATKSVYAFAGMKSYMHISSKRSQFKGLQVRKIGILRIHPRYSKELMNNDIMLGKTEIPWNFGDDVNAINIVGLERYNLKNISKLKAVGFEKEANTGYVINMFEVGVTIINVTDCSDKWNRLQKRSVVCSRKPGTSICPYNAGGPLVNSDLTLLGIITTFWRTCREPQEDMMFTYLPYYARWIKSVMMPHKRCFSMITSHRISVILVIGTFMFLLFQFYSTLLCQNY